VKAVESVVAAVVIDDGDVDDGEEEEDIALKDKASSSVPISL
jgi:hypothetical protein